MRLLVGEHRGILRAVKREISELKRSFDAVQDDMRELRSAFDTRLPEIEQRLDKIDDRCARHHPLNAPGHESIGTFFARAGLKALEIFAVAAALGALYVLASLAGVAP
jgi:hypothetical protein